MLPKSAPALRWCRPIIPRTTRTSRAGDQPGRGSCCADVRPEAEASGRLLAGKGLCGGSDSATPKTTPENPVQYWGDTKLKQSGITKKSYGAKRVLTLATSRQDSRWAALCSLSSESALASGDLWDCVSWPSVVRGLCSIEHRTPCVYAHRHKSEALKSDFGLA